MLKTFTRKISLLFLGLVTLFACSPHARHMRISPSPCAYNSSLISAAHKAGKIIGTAYRSIYAKNDSCYTAIAAHDFSSLTTEIGTMTDIVEPQAGKFNFQEADAVWKTAQHNHQEFNIHALIWDPLDQQVWGIVPQWIKQESPQQRHRTMLTLISTIMHHFRGKAATVTVVNEAFDQMGHLQHNTWWQTTQSDQYIIDAFRAARIADPYALLFYNDHSAETHSDKSNAIYALVKKLHSMHISVIKNGQRVSLPLIDGIGFQSHMLGGLDQQPSVSDMRSNLQRFADLGLHIRLTELDVRIPVLKGNTNQADLLRQRSVYHIMTQLCAQQKMCDGITLWGFTDKHSWITDYPRTFSGYGAANIYNMNYQRKPAWDGIYSGLEQ